MTITPELTVNIIAAIAIVCFLWSLHRDINGLRDRISKLEGTVNVLAGFLMGEHKPVNK